MRRGDYSPKTVLRFTRLTQLSGTPSRNCADCRLPSGTYFCACVWRMDTVNIF
ncbi:hypothetical protein KCP69_10915 [Salmonella enterica subsp. enterica]|nr:hypothetical protein KCP69_10915 [Salmonella enterica subsp. enterica]